jgi:hypothetical protein
MESPALPENKAPLLTPSCAFSGVSLSSLLRLLSLADLCPVPLIPRWHSAPLPSLPALSHAGLLASSLEAMWGVCFPVPMGTRRVPLRMPALRRVDPGYRVHALSPGTPPTIPFGSGVSATFPWCSSRRLTRRCLSSAEGTGLVGHPLCGSQKPNCCSQASDPHEWRSVTPAASSSSRRPGTAPSGALFHTVKGRATKAS